MKCRFKCQWGCKGWEMVCLARSQRGTWVHIATSLHGLYQVKWMESWSEGLDLHSLLRSSWTPGRRPTLFQLSLWMFITLFLLSCRLSRQWGTTPAFCPLAQVVLLWVASDPSGRYALQLATHWACLLTWDWGPMDLNPSSDTLDAPTLPTPGKTALPNLDPPQQVH